MSKVAPKGLEEIKLSEPVRRRLPAYYRALVGLYAEGYLKISSDQLAEVMGLAPSQIRTDMSAIGCAGHKGYGYLITEAYKRIGEVMQLNDKYRAVAIGDGALADAVCQSSLFTKRGVKLIGRFSTPPAEKQDTPTPQGLMPLNELENFCRNNKIDIMIFACDGATATQCVRIAEGLGISGIMNFSETDINSSIIAIRNLHIEDALMMLCSEIKKDD